jgi:hypothetical protein
VKEEEQKRKEEEQKRKKLEIENQALIAFLKQKGATDEEIQNHLDNLSF